MRRKKFDAVLKAVASLFQALSHPQRIRLIGLLQNEEMDVSQLQEAIGISQSSVSQHLKLLKLHHLVIERRCGKHVYYHLSNPLIKEIVTIAIELECEDFSSESETAELLQEMKTLW